MNIFMSVGTGLNSSQEEFVTALEQRLRAEGLNPCTVGRNTFSSDMPLKAITKLMDRCEGTVVVAVERYFYPNGVERRGSEREKQMENVQLPTTWNQIEAAMAYDRGHPLLVIVDQHLRPDGLLEPGNDWYVLQLDPIPKALQSVSFNGVLADWRDRLKTRVKRIDTEVGIMSPANMSIAELVGALKPDQLWTVLGACGAFAAGAFSLGMIIGG